MDQRTASRWALWVVLVLLTVAGAGSLLRGVRASSDQEAAALARHAYSEKIAAGYNNRFGASTYFLPSLATTDTGEFIDPKNFATAKYCGHCHQAVSYTHLRAHETVLDLVCRLLLEKKKQ